MSDIHTGGCLCGAIRYRLTGQPARTTICHCTFCQRRTGTAFAEIVTFEDKHVALEGEEPRMYQHRSDESGRWIRVHFCPHCGTQLFITAEARPGFLSMAGGTLDDSSWVEWGRHIWARSSQHWLPIPDGPARFEKAPTA
jgi:hypothetical protein